LQVRDTCLPPSSPSERYGKGKLMEEMKDILFVVEQYEDGLITDTEAYMRISEIILTKLVEAVPYDRR
jgi:hypothetical protein